MFGYAYDALNRLIALTDEDDATTELTRSPAGDVVAHEDPNAVVTTYVRNGWGEAIREESPDIGTTDYVRDARGLVTQMTDGRGIVSQYTYDDAGRLTGIVYPAAPSENVAFSYDDTANNNKGVGRLTGMDDGSGVSAFTYDLRDEITRVEGSVVGRWRSRC